MTYDRPDDRDPAPPPAPASASASATRTDLPRQTEFRLVGRPAPADGDREEPLLSGMEELRAGWQRVKAAFVDNPRGAVAEAAVLADEAAEALAAALRERRQQIRGTWDGDGGPSRDTEALRRALLRYQALFKSITRD